METFVILHSCSVNSFQWLYFIVSNLSMFCILFLLQLFAGNTRLSTPTYTGSTVASTTWTCFIYELSYTLCNTVTILVTLSYQNTMNGIVAPCSLSILDCHVVIQNDILTKVISV